MDRTGKRRLLKLADLLMKDARNRKGIKFDLGDWGDSTAFVKDEFGGHYEPVSHSCGTTACALGLAVVSGEFERAGLRNGSYTPTSIRPTFGDQYGFYAGAALFRISLYESQFLFDPAFYPDDDKKTKGASGERFVAKRIRDFANGKTKAT